MFEQRAHVRMCDDDNDAIENISIRSIDGWKILK